MRDVNTLRRGIKNYLQSLKSYSKTNVNGKPWRKDFTTEERTNIILLANSDDITNVNIAYQIVIARLNGDQDVQF